MRTPTPWAATLRSALITALAIAPALPDIARAAGLDTVPFVASVLAISGAVTRVLAVPAVADQIDRLSGRATPSRNSGADCSDEQSGRHRLD